MAQNRVLQDRSTNNEGGAQSAQRNMIDGRVLRAAADAQANADADHPVAVQASLRDLVVAFEPMIQARKEARWTDAEICGWLRQLGFNISQDTLRTYRSQLCIGIRAPTKAASTRQDDCQGPGGAARLLAAQTDVTPPLAIELPQDRSDSHAPALSATAIPETTSTSQPPRRAITTDELDDGV